MISAITRATTLIINPIIRTPWNVSRNATDPQMNDPTNAYSPATLIQRQLWMDDPMLASRAPTSDFDRPLVPYAARLRKDEFWSTVLTHALWWGQGGVMYVPRADGQPLVGSLRVVNPFTVNATPDGRWMMVDPNNADDPLISDGEGNFNVGGITWTLRMMRGLPPHDGNTPEGVLTRHGWTIKTAARLQMFENNSLTSGVPAGVLKVNVPNYDEEMANNLKASWMRAHGGDRRGIAVLNAGVDFSPLSITPIDADLTKLRQLSLVDVAHAFGLSAALLDASAGNSLTYANLKDKRRETVDDILGPFGSRFEQFVSSMMPFGTSMSVNWQAYLSTDPNDTVNYVKTAIDTGVMTTAEGRAALNLPVVPEEGGDTNTGTSNEERAARMLQMIYLGVGRVITVDEARRFMAAAGVEMDENVTLDDIRESLPPKSQTFGEAMGEEPAA